MFEPEYVRLVIKPKLDLILEEGVESVIDLTSKFNKAFDCKVSGSRITGWLKSIGYQITRTVQIQRPAFQATREPARDSVFNDDRAARQQIPFNYPSPTSVFSNVPMPGFQE